MTFNVQSWSKINSKINRKHISMIRKKMIPWLFATYPSNYLSTLSKLLCQRSHVCIPSQCSQIRAQGSPILTNMLAKNILCNLMRSSWLKPWVLRHFVQPLLFLITWPVLINDKRIILLLYFFSKEYILSSTLHLLSSLIK